MVRVVNTVAVTRFTPPLTCREGPIITSIILVIWECLG
jgi:hypothetical protein